MCFHFSGAISLYGVISLGEVGATDFFRVDGSEDYTFISSLILLTRNTQHRENWHCLCPRRLSTAL